MTRGQIFGGGRRSRGVPPNNAYVNIWGQSNAGGEAEASDISASPLSSDAGLAAYYAATFSRVYIWTGSTFAQLDPDVNAQAGQATYFGPEFGLAVEWTRNTTAGNLYLVKSSMGSQSIEQWESTAGAMYLAGQAKHDGAMAWFSSNSVSIDITGMVWVQGEADMGMSESWYRTRLDDLVSAWEADGIAASPTPIVLWQMSTSSTSYGSGVAAAKTAKAATDARITAPTGPDYLKGDSVHFNGRGQMNIGYQSASTIFGFPLETI